MSNCECDLTAVDFRFSEVNAAWKPAAYMKFNNGDQVAWNTLSRKVKATNLVQSPSILQNYLNADDTKKVISLIENGLAFNTDRANAASQISTDLKNWDGSDWNVVVGKTFNSFILH